MKNNWIHERETEKTMEYYTTGVHFQLSQRGMNRCIDGHISLGRYMLVHCHSLLGHIMKLGHH